MIKNIVFDIGDVLVIYKEPSFLCRYGISEKEAEFVIDGVLFSEKEDIWHRMDLGLMTERECCKEYCRSFQEHTNGIRTFFTHMDEWYADNKETWNLIPKLKDAGYGLYILSNWNAECYERCISHMPFIKYMDGIVISAYEGVRKPDSEIYRRLLKRYGLSPQETFFFDDKEKNVAAARNEGISGMTVRNQRELRERMRAFL